MATGPRSLGFRLHQVGDPVAHVGRLGRLGRGVGGGAFASCLYFTNGVLATPIRWARVENNLGTSLDIEWFTFCMINSLLTYKFLPTCCTINLLVV